MKMFVLAALFIVMASCGKHEVNISMGEGGTNNKQIRADVDSDIELIGVDQSVENNE